MHDVVHPRTPVGEAEIKDVAHAALLLGESLNRLQDHLADVDAATDVRGWLGCAAIQANQLTDLLLGHRLRLSALEVASVHGL